jgi:hypothetical protein
MPFVQMLPGVTIELRRTTSFFVAGLDRFYTRQTKGVRFLAWVTAAIQGKSVDDGACEDSETPEYHWERPQSPQ